MPKLIKPEGASRRAIAAWCLYDWSATPFHSVINTFVFSIYFSRSVYGDETAGSAAWAYATGFAGLIIALISPVCGAIADRSGNRKIWVGVFTVVNIAAVSLLWFIKPDHSYVDSALALMIVATIGGELSLVFYNAMIVDLVPERKLGRLSGFGWAAGYAGGLAALGLVLAGLVLPEQPWLGISKDSSINLRITGPMVALWSIAFAWPLFLYVPEQGRKDANWRQAVTAGLKQLRATLAGLPKHRDMFWFLISSALYRDGLTTLFAIGGQYAAGTFGMDFEQVLIFAIGINITAVFGCLAFGWLDDRIGAKAVIMLSLTGLVTTGIVLILLQDKALFIPVALVMGIFIGPVQSSGRSLMARLAPPETMTEMFGLYQFAGRSVSFFGPLAFATVTMAFHSQRCGMASVLLFILVGLILMIRIRAK